MSIYFVPTEKEYLSRRLDKSRSWKDTYDRPCCVCGKHFLPGNAYIRVSEDKFRHLTCDQPIS